jgi:hypothetical protein
LRALAAKMELDMPDRMELDVPGLSKLPQAFSTA